MSGFELLHASLPTPMLRLVDPAGTVSDDVVRRVLAIAIASFLFAFLVRTGLRVTGGTVRLLQGRSVVLRSNRTVVFLRTLAGLAAMGLPWAAVWFIYDSGRADDAFHGWAGLAATVWLLLRACDHGAAWLDKGRGCVVLQRGFGIGRVRRTVVPVADLFGTGSGSPLPPADARPVGTQAWPLRAGWDVVVEHLGSAEQAEQWTRKLLPRLGLSPGGPWRVVG